MDQEKNVQTSSIDVGRLLDALVQKMWLVLLAAIIGAIIAFMGTLFFIKPSYRSSVKFYVNNSSISVGDTSFSIDSGDISASKSLVNSYIVILQTRDSLNDVIDYAGIDRSYSEVRGMISARAVDATQIFEVVIESKDPMEALAIAEATAHILPKRISSIIEGSSAKVVDYPVMATRPSSPSYTKNVLVGFVIGLMLSAGIIVIAELFDVTIRTEEDIQQSGNLPILASVPDMMTTGKGGYDYSYDNKSHETKKGAHAGRRKEPVLIGGDVTFAAAEAYKLLRTKLQFSFADENASHVIGVSSALSGEGKSLSAINLAYTLSQLDKKVILIDCDMRRPTLADKLSIRKKPGLSSLLTGQSGLDGLIQYCGIKNDEKAFHVITAGQNPPNPIELLSSARMQRVIQELRRNYDYVIFDLPPVSEVSDAIAIAKQTDGILLVVRQNYCDRQILSDTIRQFEFVDAKILGVVYNAVEEGSGKGYYKKYYNKYNKKYYSKYHRSYNSAAARNNSKASGNQLTAAGQEKE